MRLATILTSVGLLAATTADAAKWGTPGSEIWGACARALRPLDTPHIGYNAGLCDGTINAVLMTSACPKEFHASKPRAWSRATSRLPVQLVERDLFGLRRGRI
jgi:hypothetical protein